MKATMEAMEQQLLDWAAWLTVGDGSGYARLSVLHEDWSPPSAGQTPTLKAYRASASPRLHSAIRKLSLRQQNTLVVRYCLRLDLSAQAERLECQPSTVNRRVLDAKRQLLTLLSDSG